MPDIRMNVQALPTITTECDKLFGRDIVTGQCQGHDKALAVGGEEQLAAVGMVIRAPDQSPLTLLRRPIRLGLLGQATPGEQVAAADGVVARVQRVPFPPELEHALGHAALVARVGVHGPPPLRRPPHDLDPVRGRVLHDLAVPLDTLGRGLHERRLEDLAHARRGHVRDFAGVEICRWCCCCCCRVGHAVGG